MKNPIFKPEFEAKLNDLGVRREFIKNVINRIITNHESAKHAIMSINKAMCFKVFVLGAFEWTKSTEGFDFWSNISEQ